MRFTAPAAVLAFALVARADDDLDFDMDDVPSACKTICKPVDILVDRCDVDLHHGSDRMEDLLQNQCICTNKSFDFAKVAALCADCMHGTRRRRDDHDHDRADKDDLEDIDRILHVCGFASTKYDAAAATALANGVRVDATAPSRTEQLTTTIDRSHPANNNGGGATVAPPASSPTKPAQGTTQPATMQTTASPSAGSSSGSSGTKTTSSVTSSTSGAAAGAVAANLGFAAVVAAGLML